MLYFKVKGLQCYDYSHKFLTEKSVIESQRDFTVQNLKIQEVLCYILKLNDCSVMTI